MKKSILSIAASFVFLAAVSFAQTTPADSSQGTQGAAPSTQQDPSMGQGSSSGQSGSSMGQSSGSGMGQGSSTGQGSEMKGEKKMKGCIKSEGGQYMLEDKHGKSTSLSGQDLSAHVGHEVTVHGSWGSGSSSDSSAASSGGSMGSGKTFNVTKVDMISETCTMGKSKSSSDTMQKQ